MQRNSYLGALTVLALLAGLAQAAPPTLVKDINTAPVPGSGSVYPTSFLKLNGKVYFTADTLASGRELYVTDGTTTGTNLVKDIYAGAADSGISGLTPLDATRFVFAANDGTTGSELWISNGTTAGTVLLKNINLTVDSAGHEYGSSPRGLTSVGGGIVLFWANDGVNGTEVWRTDGTTAGTYRLSDIAPGSASANPQVPGFIAFAGKVFLAAQDVAGNAELYTTDGTNAASTTLFKEINPNGGSAPQGFAVLSDVPGNRKMLFRANDGTHGDELWVSDGTAAGTVMLKDINFGPGGSMLSGLTPYNGKMYFTANGGAAVGRELYVTDGTSAGTQLFMDLYPGRISSNPRYLTVCMGKLFFSAVDPVNGGELWVTDGTVANTTAIDTMPGINGSNPWNLCSVTLTGPGERLMFQGSDFTFFTGGGGGAKPWISDGTAAGTMVLKSGLYQGGPGYVIAPFTSVNGVALFSATEGTTTGTQLWKTDGTGVGTVLVKNLSAAGTQASLSLSNWRWTTVGSTLYFIANDGNTGYELWKSDGTDAGTVLVKDIRAGTNGSNPDFLANGGGVLFFSANDGGGARLWRSDGTDEGTYTVPQGGSPLTGSSTGDLAYNGSTVLFAASDGSGQILWSTTDGGATVTPVLDNLGNQVTSPGKFFVVGSDVYMSATVASTASGSQLYRYRGGVVSLVAVINPAGNASPGSTSPMVKLGNYLIYPATDSTGTELWRTDVTTDATIQIKDINPSGNSNPSGLTVAGSLVFFAANNGTNGIELWTTDGTTANTNMVMDINPTGTNGSNSSMSSTAGITARGNKVIFAANDGTHGTEPWVSDGTSGGTFMLRDIYVGTSSSLSFSSNTMDIINANGTVYFQARDYVGPQTPGYFGAELYKTDGTTAGTMPAADIQSGPASSYPGDFRLIGNQLFMRANDGVHGDELFVLVNP